MKGIMAPGSLCLSVLALWRLELEPEGMESWEFEAGLGYIA